MGVPIPFLIPARIAKKASTFLLIGVVGALFDYGTRTLLLHLGIPAFTARGCSYIVGSVVAYYLNSFYTFDGNRSASEKLRAAVVYLFCFAVAVVFDFEVSQVLFRLSRWEIWNMPRKFDQDAKDRVVVL